MFGKKFNTEIGKAGERIAAKHLTKTGLRVIESNFHTRFGEIDIIAKDKEFLVFVEVKTKVGEAFGAPEEMFDKRKFKKVKRMAEVYLLSNPELAARFAQQRIDVVAIVLSESGSVLSLRHYKNVQL